ncbi:MULTISPECIES: D-aminoacyl-tRNA deacylase [unclassified Maribellus]|uniref:D-aminoacyl-tRNA deacylase n=1 Tax=unclassified Maribellus TaxID=2678353 RepID=UPI001F3B0043|nr:MULTISPECIES: D-aminoacyl-tRNA deacylase [unclassified Maribellus]MCE4564050.1 D-tyrosyl-tRNA(Tyr) deacylase [Maribellus sp. CM-23]MCK3686091.1 D-aminoacyl-tRNA deacylase [Maribellus sp. YY47]
MRVVIQKVKEASVTVEGEKISAIETGLLVLVGIESEDTEEDISYLVKKIAQLRVFDDENGVMNLSVQDVGGDVIVVSQFTLQASTKKGNRPSYIRAARPEFSIPMYEKFVASMEEALGKKVGTGKFGAMMEVALVNDGPVTIIIDSKQKDF